MSGRPSSYTQEVADEICERISKGESLRSICSDEEGGWLPGETTVRRWLSGDEEWNRLFRRQYAVAREAQAETIFDEILEIADDARNDWMQRRGEHDAGWVENGEHVQRSRIRIDARKWMAGKLAPKKYGDRILNEHSGPDGGPIPLQQTVDLSGLTPDQIRVLASIKLPTDG